VRARNTLGAVREDQSRWSLQMRLRHPDWGGILMRTARPGGQARTRPPTAAGASGASGATEVATIYGRDDCERCRQARTALANLVRKCKFRPIDQALNVHEGWREDGSVDVRAALCFYERLPIVEMNGVYCNLDEARQLLRDTARSAPVSYSQSGDASPARDCGGDACDLSVSARSRSRVGSEN